MRNLIQSAERILVFTGAGISTGSGIADFRGPQGVWKRRQPVYFDEFCASHDKRVEYWEYKLEGYPSFKEARPNAAHLALTELWRQGKLELLVTQNVDGLHSEAGIPDEKLVEIHGTNRLVSCIECAATESPERAFAHFESTGDPPTCQCGGFLKPATISFGQSMPQDKMDQAFAAAERCDLVMSLGSTCSVYPAASVPASAARRGVPYIVVNRGATDHDAIATHKFEDDLVTLLPQWVTTSS